MVESLLDLGANVNLCDGRTYVVRISRMITHTIRSPLQIAVEEGDINIFRILLSRGADPNPSPAETPLSVAVRCGHDTMVKELLDHGADPNSLAVLTAAAVGNIAVMLMLIEYGADIHIKGDSGRVLWCAASNMHVEMVKFLLDNGLDVNASSDKDGY